MTITLSWSSTKTPTEMKGPDNEWATLTTAFQNHIFMLAKKTLKRVNQWERHKKFMKGPWSRFLNQKVKAVTDLTKEFLVSFSFKTRNLTMWGEDAVEFMCGGEWYTASMTQLGIDLGIHTSDETDSPIWYESMTTFADEDVDESAEAGDTRKQAWEQLSFGDEKLYLKYMWLLVEKTDFGRLAGPSLLRLADESLNAGTYGSGYNGQLSEEIWDKLEHTLENGSSFITNPDLFGCYLMMNINDPMSLNAALRYWGCAVQAGALVSGAFGISHSSYEHQHVETTKTKFSPLPFASFTPISFTPPLNWRDIMHNENSKDAQELLLRTGLNEHTQSVTFDPVNKTVTLLMPGFDKSEIKLYQYRGGSELLIEAGDQRRVVFLPSQIQGKVGGAKFIDRKLIITMR
ncbi:ATPase GET3D, chloroplastic-like [Bidens hawaiensis]|uniref:ATPase GET3D, chloroplastic-like n=1 Tax=Bidens hawaiensis TaxID=980011 RepID=UPI00404A6FE1